MLTPHEVATLMLIDDAAPNLADLDRASIKALIERQLVHLEKLAYGDRLHITTRGSDFLHALAQGVRSSTHWY